MSASPCRSPQTPVVATAAPPTAQELWQHYHQQADLSTENALVERYLPLVVSVLGRLAMTLPEHVSHDDLHSAGLVGLLQALRNFDPTCGSSFETYARIRVRGAMLDELRRMDWVPRTIHEKARKIQDAMGGWNKNWAARRRKRRWPRRWGCPCANTTNCWMKSGPASFVCLDSAGTSEDGDAGSLYEVIANLTEENPVDQVSQRELKQRDVRTAEAIAGDPAQSAGALLC